ncbi:MAG: type II toxin-antitoxin system MqsA family antitoxin [Pseudomonas sp.]|nr:type II toxin-antitoxin system MqsA family antitoxin [Pseudomonas sp.]
MKKQDCASCGAQNGMQHFEARAFTVDFKQLNRAIRDLSGWQCQVCDEIEFDPQSAVRYSQAGDQLIEDSKRVMADEMKRIRRKLHFTQKTAVQLLSGGGHNAFSRYERAEIEPPKPLFILMRLLDRHPELVNDLLEISKGADMSHLLAAKELERQTAQGC